MGPIWYYTQTQHYVGTADPKLRPPRLPLQPCCSHYQQRHLESRVEIQRSMRMDSERTLVFIYSSEENMS